MEPKKKLTFCGMDALRWPPPTVGVFFLFVGIAINVLVPSLAVVLYQNVLLGGALMLLGSAPIFWSLALFYKRCTTVYPKGQTSSLVIEGPFRFSRNPIYLGATVVLLGVAIVWGTLPLLIAPLGFFLFMNNFFIPFEERRLLKTFGSAYTVYCASVRRWL